MIVKILLFVAMGATTLALLLGIGGMLGKTKFYEAYGNRLMQARVFFQGIALALFTILFLLKR